MKKCTTCTATLDTTNVRIVKRLERNARTSYATIAQELSLSVNTVRDRILNMQRKGIILGYQPVTDQTLCGRPVQAMVCLRSSGRTQPVSPEELRHPYLRAAYTSPGPVNLVLEVHGPTMKDITDFVSETIYPLGYHSAHFFLVDSGLETPVSEPQLTVEDTGILAEAFP